MVSAAYTESFMLSCPSKKLMLIDCPGCGLQRSAWALLSGDVSASWELYPPTPFILLTLGFLIIHLIFNLKHGAAVIKYSYIITAITILINYVYKIINLQLL